MGVRGTSDDSEWEATYRFADDQIDRATHRFILMRQWTRALKAGVEVNPGADEIGLVANWRLLDETARRPALILGTSKRPDRHARRTVVLRDALEEPPSRDRHPDRPLRRDQLVGSGGPVRLSVRRLARPPRPRLRDAPERRRAHARRGDVRPRQARWAITLLAIRLEEPGITVGTRF